jgi:hypothetical protein
VARTVRFSQVLWLLTTAWLASCGRIGFGAHGDDSPPPIDAPGIPSVIDAMPDAPRGPILGVVPPAQQAAQCGDMPAPQVLTLENHGDQDLVVSALDINPVSPNDPRYAFTSDFSPMTIAKGGSATVTLQPPTTTIGTDFANTVIANSLQFHTNEPALPAPIPVSLKVTGANVIANPTTLTFTGTGGKCPADIPVKLTNTGTKAIDLTANGSSGVNALASGFNSGSLPANSTVTVLVHVTTSSACTNANNGMLIIDAMSGTVCNATGSITLDASLSITGSASGTCFCS